MSRHAQETGFTSSGPINMGSQQITNLAAGTAGSHAVNKDQVDILIPIGGITMFAGTTGYDTSVWQLCDGSALSRTTFTTLFARLGTTHGAGDGVNTFNVPDLRGRFIAGSGQGGGLTNRVLGATGGAEAVALTSASQLPSHTHTGTTDSGGVAHTHGVTGDTASNGAHTHTGTSDPGGVAHTHGVSATTGGQSNNHVHWYDNYTESTSVLSLVSWGAAGNYAGGGTKWAMYDPGRGEWHQHRSYGYTGGANNGSGAYQDHSHSFSTTSDGASATNHTHGFTTASNGAHTHSISLTSGAASATSHTHTFTTGATGSGATHENMPPFYVLTYLIRKA